MQYVIEVVGDAIPGKERQAMTLGDKLRSLRAVEGSLRGLGRAMTQLEMVKAMKREVGKNLSQAYLSQIESGARPHLTNTTQQLLARFFRVYPGFLVDDPPGYARELQSELRVVDAKVDSWLYAGASQFTADPELQRALLAVAEHEDSRQALLLLAEILRAPGLADRLSEVLRPASQTSSAAPPSSRCDPQNANPLTVRGYLQN
ncbi:MAG: helix-turn-helix domain-containing protein [Candidatus Acidiferrum sp.]